MHNRSSRVDRRAQRRERVLSSQAFADWWAVRQDQEPKPTNPYQAYMIDLSLQAKIETKKEWEKEPNRSDQIDIDFPYGDAPNWVPERAPANKPRQRHEPRERSPELPAAGLHRDLQLAADDMAVRYGQPAPIVNVFSAGPNRSYARVGVGRMGGRLVRAGGGVANIGLRRKEKLTPVDYGTLYHEVGHIIHAQNSFVPEEKRVRGLKPFMGTSSSYSDEQQATKLAREQIKIKLSPHGEQAIANWDLAWALNTYRRGWKARGNPVKVDRAGNILFGGS